MYHIPIPTYQPMKTKSPGSILIVAIILGAIVLSLGLNLVRIFAKEVHFAADLLFSEQAYFAAESGAEKALIKLKNEPVEYLKDHKIEFGNKVKTILNIENLKEAFSFPLPPKGNIKFRLQKDLDPSETTTLEAVDSWDLQVAAETDFNNEKIWQWKIFCQKDQKTLGIQNTLEVGEFLSFQEQRGTFTNVDGNSFPLVSIADFFTSLTPEEKQTCFFSATNMSETETLDFKFENIEKMSPEKARVVSTGIAKNRSKTIIFDYAQKKLGTLFDFVLFHSGQN